MEAAVDFGNIDRVLVRSILEHAPNFPWMTSDIGLLGLRLDEQREHRLHVWAPDRSMGPPVIHDHPYDFVSRIIAGQFTNVRYAEDPSGTNYRRDRYSPPAEDERTTDTIQLTGTAETYREGDQYAQLAHELHDSYQVPGTVTILRLRFRGVNELTVCRPEGAPWLSAQSRPATLEEVKEITSMALDLF
jgi:hypothetical protein